MLLPLFHASVVGINCYTLWYDQVYMDLPFPAKGYSELPFKGRPMFLTMWCMALQTLYFSISFLNDIFGTYDKSSRTPLIRKLKDYMFSVAFPLGIYVCVGFWIIYGVDKELIFPEHIELVVPFWANSVLHIFVAVFIIIEILVNTVTYPSRSVGVATLLIFNTTYLVWMHFLHERTGKWAYPLFEQFNLPIRIIFLIISMVIGLSFYVMGEKIAFYLNSRPVSKMNGHHANGVHKKKF